MTTINQNNQLKSLRRQIDAVDRRIVREIKNRLNIASLIGKEKKHLDLPIINTARELEVISRVEKGFFQSIFKRIIEGYIFIKKHKGVLYPFLLLMGLQICLAVLVINLPLVASDVLKVSVNSSGPFVVLPIGLGAAVGALTVPKLLKAGWRKKRAIEIFLMVIAPTIFLLAFLIPDMVLFYRILLGELMLVLAGIAFVGILIPTQTFLQEVTPGGFRGRVFGNYWFLVTIATIFPVLFAGALTELFGIRLLLLILGCVAISILFYSKRYGQQLIENGFS